MIQLQFTLFCTSGKYKPMSTILKVDNVEEYTANKAEMQKKAIQKICVQRGMTSKDLKKNDYTKIKVRVYDKEKIQAENQARYERIKKERGWN